MTSPVASPSTDALHRAANRQLRRLRIDESDLDAEGAISLAFVELRSTDNKLHAFREDNEFMKLACGAERRVILRQERRSRSVKRGGAGRSRTDSDRGQETGTKDDGPVDRGFRRINADLDQVRSRDATAEDVVVAKLAFQALVESLPDDLHRKILIMQDQGFNITEIADKLGLDRRTVGRKLDTIRRIYQHPGNRW